MLPKPGHLLLSEDCECRRLCLPGKSQILWDFSLFTRYQAKCLWPWDIWLPSFKCQALGLLEISLLGTDFQKKIQSKEWFFLSFQGYYITQHFLNRNDYLWHTHWGKKYLNIFCLPSGWFLNLEVKELGKFVLWKAICKVLSFQS